MQTKLLAGQLEPGMYVVNSGVSWKDNPYLYAKEGHLTAAIIEKLLKDGYHEAVIDTDKAQKVEGKQEEGGAESLEHSFGDSVCEVEMDFEVPEISLVAEMDAAKPVYADSLKMSKTFMDNIRQGNKVELHKAKGVVEHLIASVTRNPDAMLTLSKLREEDEYSYSHSVNVAVLAVAFARYMSFPKSTQFEVGMAGMFQDLGNAMIPAELLNAPRALSNEELVIMKRHPRLGYEYVKKTPGFTQEILMGIYDHHERYNGSGYPRGLDCEKISMTGRILAMVDVYDALTSKRPHRQAMLPHKVLGSMYKTRSADFFPGFMEHFIRMLGIYPVGSVVEVSGGYSGVVTGSNPSKPTKPKVLLLLDADKNRVPPQELDTSLDGAPSVTRCLLEDESPIDPGKVLNAK